MASTIRGIFVQYFGAIRSDCFFSGRLPYTIGKSINDYSAKVIYNGGGTVQLPYNDGIFIDYRHFDKNNITPRFEFGFGLSYTTFQYSALAIAGTTVGGSAPTGSALDPWQVVHYCFP